MGEDTLVPGQLISGRFRLQHMLGRGGMGSVWQAYHLALETEIAIKFLDPQLSSRTDIRSRFAQEATAAARIKSPHVVGILDYGFTEDGRGFIAMELLKGEDLAQRIERLGGLTPAETAVVVCQACRGLAKAHASNIVHRDLKPENLFVVEDEDEILVKILDFGIAKAVGLGGSTHKTDTGQLLGTPLYMSPEQALGRPIDSRSDLYSLTVVAYRSLAGRPPFVCDAVGELIVAVSTLGPPPPSAFNPTLPAALDDWFAGMMLKDPNARSCQTARELADSFEAVCKNLQGSPLRAATARAKTPPNAYLPTLPETPTEAIPGALQRTEAGVTAGLRPSGAATETQPPPDARRSRRQRQQRLAGAGLAALGAAGVLAFALDRGTRTPAAPQPDGLAALAPQPAEPAGSVSLRLSAAPPNATLFLDGERLAGNPHLSARARDGRPRVLRAEAPGHLALERSVTLDRDLTLELTLTPLDSRETRPATSSRSAAAPPRTELLRPRAPARPPTAPSAEPLPAASAPPPARDIKKPFDIDRSDPWNSR